MQDEQLTASTPCGLDQQFPPHLHFRVTCRRLEVLGTHGRPTESEFGGGGDFLKLLHVTLIMVIHKQALGNHCYRMTNC